MHHATILITKKQLFLNGETICTGYLTVVVMQSLTYLKTIRISCGYSVIQQINTGVMHPKVTASKKGMSINLGRDPITTLRLS